MVLQGTLSARQFGWLKHLPMDFIQRIQHVCHDMLVDLNYRILTKADGLQQLTINEIIYNRIMCAYGAGAVVPELWCPRCGSRSVVPKVLCTECGIRDDMAITYI